MMGYNFWSHSFKVLKNICTNWNFFKKKKKVLKVKHKHEKCHECCAENERNHTEAAIKDV